MTGSPPKARAGTIATASWVASSTMVRHFMTRPSAVRSKTKSADQTWLRRSGRTSGWRSAIGIFLRRRRFNWSRASGVQAIDPFVIDDVAGLPQLQIDHPGPIASMSLRQVNDPIPDDRIAIGPWYVPEGRRAHLPHGQGPALAEAPRDHLPHHLPSNRCGHHFFRSTSRVTSISSCDSAKSFLSRPFSVSSSFRRFASETLIPPNLLRQR